MDTKNLVESEYVSTELVNNSPTKTLVILSAGALTPDKFNEGQNRFQCLVEIDGQQKKYKPNKPTLKNLHAKYGTDSAAWVGKQVNLVITSMNGKITIIGTV